MPLNLADVVESGKRVLGLDAKTLKVADVYRQMLSLLESNRDSSGFVTQAVFLQFELLAMSVAGNVRLFGLDPPIMTDSSYVDALKTAALNCKVSAVVGGNNGSDCDFLPQSANIRLIPRVITNGWRQYDAGRFMTEIIYDSGTPSPREPGNFFRASMVYTRGWTDIRKTLKERERIFDASPAQFTPPSRVYFSDGAAL